MLLLLVVQSVSPVSYTHLDNVIVFGADSDASPYDSGSYASSTTYVTGKAVEKACLELKDHLCEIGAQMLDCAKSEVEFTGQGIETLVGQKSVSLSDIATKSMLSLIHI